MNQLNSVLTVAWSANAMIMLLFAVRVYAALKKDPTTLNVTFFRFSLLTSLAYFFYAMWAFSDYRPFTLSWQSFLGDPFLYIAAGYMAVFAWRILFPRRRAELMFRLFVGAAALNALLYVPYFLNALNTYWAVQILSIVMIGLLYPFIGVMFIRESVRHPLARARFFFLGLGFVIGSIFGIAAYLVSPPELILAFNLISTAGFVAGFISVILQPSRHHRAAALAAKQ